jgi:hypothetical protein
MRGDRKKWLLQRSRYQRKSKLTRGVMEVGTGDTNRIQNLQVNNGHYHMGRNAV